MPDRKNDQPPTRRVLRPVHQEHRALYKIKELNLEHPMQTPFLFSPCLGDGVGLGGDLRQVRGRQLARPGANGQLGATAKELGKLYVHSGVAVNSPFLCRLA